MNVKLTMIKHCIVKSKGDTIVCLVSEVEKPIEYTSKPLMDLIGMGEAKKQWLRSFKEYSIRNEDKEELIEYLEYNNLIVNGNELSEGIEIAADLVEIKAVDIGDGYEINGERSCVKYITLKPTIKESLQVESDAIEFGNYILEQLELEQLSDSIIKGTWVASHKTLL